jgi:hypothetical protein
MIMHRVFSAVLGLALAVAGLTASGYIPTTFKGDTLASGAIALLIPSVLMLSASTWHSVFLNLLSPKRSEEPGHSAGNLQQ